MTPSRFGFNRATSYAKDRQAGIGRRTRSGMMNGVSWRTLRWRGVDSNFEFLDAFVRSASSSDLLERAFWR